MEPLFDSMNDLRCVDSCWPGGAAAEARGTSLTKKDWRSVHNMERERERGGVCVCVHKKGRNLSLEVLQGYYEQIVTL